MTDFNTAVIEEFRAGEGRVGGPFENARLLLLTTTGARSGKPHTVPLGFLHDGQGRMLVIASAAGSARHPAWYHNLRANPRATVETGTSTFEADAEILPERERAEAFARAVEADPGWAEYQRKTVRVIPVVALVPVAAKPSDRRWGDDLVAIHTVFRRELALVRHEIASSGPGLGAQLRINCLMVCRGLSHHHTAEDTELFPALDEQHPELGPVMRRLRAGHEVVERLIGELQAAIGTDGLGRDELREKAEHLTKEVEAHLDYEEEQLVPVLNRMPEA
ncbi:nitroreductase/quinone reductase family protein [Saccharomonospora cyanea]|uniref:Deazaflavin-dependent nitroreductase family protein n=1 Tax=Saccharomonospora cyanea NA-134 TaxID=882082 RepID=H5XL47_9PSEU|nr:nitroreductase/quinone reductase family protein [Saccharomonospora cyanea]EHR63079.1 deazaflavin-dependent nitroreductase family protein [Saccharomonospora cyanea NA-134]